ncbi:MAG: DIP1984 family protein [Marinobacter sp.]|uniref:DIP1984 family protein n=1 Tax=Marinobacter sp. TaxID=50741 RepID=UPI00396E1285
MRLAEALSLRADLQRRIAQLKERIMRNAKIQIDESPAEDPNELLKEFVSCTKELRNLVIKINKTNSSVMFDEKKSLTEVLAERDELALVRDLHRDLAKNATVTQERYKALEVKFKPAVNVREIQRQADTLSKTFRELDVKIQELNWSTDLVD